MKDRIIVLKVTKYSDHHLIVTGLNTLGSKRSFLAPAALKSKKRFGGGVLEPTHFIEIQFTEPKNEDQMGILKEAHLIESFEKLRTDYDRLQAAFEILRAVEKIAQEELNDNDQLFSLIGHALRSLQTCLNPRYLVSHFEIKLLNSMGVLELEDSLRSILSQKFDSNLVLNESSLSEQGWGLYHASKREYLF